MSLIMMITLDLSSDSRGIVFVCEIRSQSEFEFKYYVHVWKIQTSVDELSWTKLKCKDTAWITKETLSFQKAQYLSLALEKTEPSSVRCRNCALFADDWVVRLKSLSHQSDQKKFIIWSTNTEIRAKLYAVFLDRGTRHERFSNYELFSSARTATYLYTSIVNFFFDHCGLIRCPCILISSLSL